MVIFHSYVNNCLPGRVIQHFWLNSELPRPQDGADPVYDEKCRQIRSTLQDLEKELETLRQKYPKVRTI